MQRLASRSTKIKNARAKRAVPKAPVKHRFDVSVSCINGLSLVVLSDYPSNSGSNRRLDYGGDSNASEHPFGFSVRVYGISEILREGRGF